MVKEYSLTLLVLLETKITDHKLVIEMLGYDAHL